VTVSILIPSSLVRETEDKREATRKLGTIARAATIFRVDQVIIFPDREGEKYWGGGFVETVLRYAATPPDLRKEVWGTRDELEYAGVLPPLHALSQTGSGSSDPGSLRQGIVTEVGPDGRVRVNCGLQHPISLPVPSKMSVQEGERVTVRVSSRRPVRAKLADEPVSGFQVYRADLPEALSWSDTGLCIAASRYGQDLTVDTLDELTSEISQRGLTIAFGAPQRGLPDIFGIDIDDVADGDPAQGFDRWVNTIPNQGSRTVRTEEAIFASLASLTLTE